MQINAGIMYNNLMLANRMNLYKTYIEKSTLRLSTGKAINPAADDPADILRISRFESQIRGSHAAQRNVQDALSLTQVMDGAFTQIHDIGLKLKELSVQYNNSSITADEKSAIESQSVELLKEMKQIMDNTSFGGIYIFKQNTYYFQTGYSADDNYTILNPIAYKDSTAVLPKTYTSAASPVSGENSHTVVKTYGMSIKLPEGQPLTGELVLNLSDIEKGKDIDFTVNTGNGEASKGKLHFSDDNTARFELHVISKGTHGTNTNIKYTGTLELSGNANKTNLTGEGTYTLDREFGGWSGKVSFTLKSQNGDPCDPEEPGDPEDPGNPNDPGTPGNGGIDFGNIDKIPVETLLTGDFIDKNILTPIAGFRAKIGIQQNILELRLSRQQQTEEVMTSALSKVQDVDVAKELMEKAKYELLLQTNIQLLSQNLDSQRDYILELLK